MSNSRFNNNIYGLTQIFNKFHFKRLTHIYSSRSHSSFSLKASNNEAFYITTPIYYVNGQPHLGHAYTSVVSDIIARYQRGNGKKVLFLTGTDEHGQKVEQSATTQNQSAIEFADQVSNEFRKLSKNLDCSNDDFIRTTETRHKKAVCELWNRLEKNGQIYLGAYEGWYSIRDEAFYSEEELVDGKAPTGANVEWVKEESYFFRLSQWTDKLLAYYEQNPDFIGPRGRKNEVVSFVSQEGGLKDLSISRTTFSWGIPVPNDPKHVIYVWLDALTNYLTAAGYPDENSALFKQFWPASVHIVGKDILRFHAVFWPAFLMAAGLDLPKRIYAHGWWTRDGEKMSKSVGNVLDPQDLIDRYGLDYVRYFMVSEINFGNDGDFSHEAFFNRINSELANDIGNLVQRVTVMIQKHCESKIPSPGDLTSEDKTLLNESKITIDTINQCLNEQNMKGISDAIINISKLGNKYIDVQAPWKLLKTDFNRMKTVLYVLTESLRCVGVLLGPIMPKSSIKMLDQLGIPIELRSFDSIKISMTPPGCTTGKPNPIFPRIENISQLSDNNNDKITNDNQEKKGSKKGSNAGNFPTFPQYDDLKSEEIIVKISQVGDTIRNMKSQKDSNKDDIKVLVGELNYLKHRLKSSNEDANSIS
eukprot:gene15848-21471_t